MIRYLLIWGAMFQERPYERIFDSMEELEDYMDLYVDTEEYSYEIRKVFPATETEEGKPQIQGEGGENGD